MGRATHKPSSAERMPLGMDKIHTNGKAPCASSRSEHTQHHHTEAFVEPRRWSEVRSAGNELRKRRADDTMAQTVAVDREASEHAARPALPNFRFVVHPLMLREAP